MANNRFKSFPGGGSAVFVCEFCKKPTRDTGHDEAALMLCKKCLFSEYVKNAASDYGVGSREHKKAVANYEALK